HRGDTRRHRGPCRSGRHLCLARPRRRQGRTEKRMTVNPQMNLGMSERLKPLHEKVSRMVRDEIMPLDEEFLAEVGRDGDRWAYTARQTEILEGLKAKAR